MESKALSLKEKLFNIRISTAPISKDITNGFFKSKYFDVNKLLEGIDEALIQNRVLLTQPIIDNKVYSILEDLDSDEKRESFLELKSDTKPQDKGSEITYYRRYTLQSLLGLVAEDDDGNKASASKQQSNNSDVAKLPFLNRNNKSDGSLTKEYLNVLKAIKEGKIKTITDVKKYYLMSKEVEQDILNQLNK